MPKKDSLGGQFAEDIKGFEEEYFFLKNLYNEKGWSTSALRYVIKRFVEGWRYDGLDKVHHTPESLDLERKVSILRELGHNRQSKIFFTTQYGENLGTIRYKELQERQAYSNSREYKGMTEEEFRQYNQSRAVTLENMIKKYGKEERPKIFEEYRQKQIYTKSKQRYIDEYGEEEGLRIVDEINKKKTHTLENFQRKYGKEEGWNRYKEYHENKHCSYSKVASKLFEELEKSLERKDLTYIYKPKNHELHLSDKGKSYYFDFCIPELKFIIEFNGDLFHGNPRLFNESDRPNPYDETLTAKDMWERDKQKVDFAKKNGYNVFVVWESEYRKDKDRILETIKELVERNYNGVI